jgi:hypothetical protein
MSDNVIHMKLLRQISSHTLRGYARVLGWLPIEGVNGDIALYQRPDSKLHQIIIPLDEQLDDYPARVADVIRKFAEYERRPTREILDQLLLSSPADIIRFREESTETDEGTVLLSRAASVVSGIRKVIASVAYSEIRPAAFHQRLSGGGSPEEFISSCRLGQTEPGSFTFSVACPLGGIGGDLFDERPYSRRVTTGLIRTLADISTAVDRGGVNDLLDRSRYPLLSANLCEGLTQLQPLGTKAQIVITPSWSRMVALQDRNLGKQVVFHQDCFQAVEHLAPRLRTAPEPEPELYIGYVDVLRGESGEDRRRRGEVHITLLLDDGESLRARAELPAEDYAEAIRAHESTEPVRFEAILNRLPRLSQLTSVQKFQRVRHDAPASSNGAGQRNLEV